MLGFQIPGIYIFLAWRHFLFCIGEKWHDASRTMFDFMMKFTFKLVFDNYIFFLEMYIFIFLIFHQNIITDHFLVANIQHIQCCKYYFKNPMAGGFLSYNSL